MKDEPRFAVAVVFADRIDVVKEGYASNIIDHYPIGILLPVECPTCSLVQLMWGDVEAVESDPDRAMGPEVIHSSHHWAPCIRCKAEIEVKVDYSEYPVGGFQPVELDEISGKAAHVAELGELVKWTRRVTKDAIEMAAAEEEDEWAWVEAHLIPGQDNVEKFIQEHRTLMERRKRLVLVLGNYKTSSAHLETIRQRLHDMGYLAVLVDQLPDFEEKAVPEKSAHFMLLSRFCVMLDDQAGGQELEYKFANDQDITLVQLVEKPQGSTFMYGTKHRTNANLKRILIEGDLLQALRQGVEWAEAQYEVRRNLVTTEEPWRGAGKSNA